MGISTIAVNARSKRLKAHYYLGTVTRRLTIPHPIPS